MYIANVVAVTATLELWSHLWSSFLVQMPVAEKEAKQKARRVIQVFTYLKAVKLKYALLVTRICSQTKKIKKIIMLIESVFN